MWSDISFGSIVHNIRTMIEYSLILHKRHQFQNRFYSTKAQKVVDNSTIWRRFVTDEWVGDCLNYLLGVITSRRWRSAYMVWTTTWDERKNIHRKLITGLRRILNISYHSFHLRCHKIVSRSRIHNSDCHNNCHNPFQEYHQYLDHYHRWNIAGYPRWRF